MARVFFSAQALADLDRIFDFLAHDDPYGARLAGERIITATQTLEYHPQIGRPIAHGMRELIISQGRTGYLALYRYLPDADRVDVLAIRHQREAGA